MQDQAGTDNHYRLAMRTFHFTLILLATTVALALAGCSQGSMAPALEFDQQKVNDIRTQIDNFEWDE
ncbi:MAG: hypothetical protein P8K79_09720 [Mariniblastus sp.]|nr:hypothetical protein [Mariniblastus sp.]